MRQYNEIYSSRTGAHLLFEQYSDRAKHVIFLTRLKAGRRGAPSLDTVHLIEALILEDQGKFAEEMWDSSDASATSPSRATAPFFAPETASAILMRLQQILPRGEAIPDSVDMPTSSDLRSAFDAAMTLKTELHYQKVEPLHLLAAVLSEHSTQTSAVLGDFGISREGAIETLRHSVPNPEILP